MAWVLSLGLPIGLTWSAASSVGESPATTRPAKAIGPTRVSLAGTWRFALDRQDAGIAERWFNRVLPDRVRLPGALQNQGFGDDITVDTKWTGDVGSDRWRQRPEYEPYRQPGAIKIPFFLQPEKHYVGAAWYQRTVEVPRAWAGRRLSLTLERPHWETQVWFDDRSLGSRDSLGTPHEYELGTEVSAGRHTLTIRVDNRVRIEVGDWSHSVSDHTQGNWNGVVGRLELAATSPVWIREVQVFPDVARRSVRLQVAIGNASQVAGRGELEVQGVRQAVRWTETGGQAELELPVPVSVHAWDEHTPELQRWVLALNGDQADDTREVSFGLREIRTHGQRFLVNGQPAFFRGTLECCIFPLTGYPPTDVESWRRILRTCRAHGLNHMRFHSWCPPEAAFEAADEIGFYYQVECGVWTQPGDGKAIDTWLYAESERIVRAYGNHPSFVLFTHGNEPHGPNHEKYLAAWVNHWKQKDPRRLVTSGSAYPQLPENQYHVHYPCRGPHGWLGKDYRQDVAKFDVPIVVHEMGQWCVYPNFAETRKYRGPLHPKNFEIFRASLAANGMGDQWPEFLRASGRLQALCYKEEIEAALRTPGISGFQLLDLHDFPGQGTALVGVLDPFWESKGYIQAKEYRRFCGSTVPLARLLKRVWTTDETLTADVEIAHFGVKPVTDAVVDWRLETHAGRKRAAGSFPALTIPLGAGTRVGQVQVPLATMAAPQASRLVVNVRGTEAANDWNVWIYPATPSKPEAAEVLVTSELGDAAQGRLASGGRVLLLATGLASVHPKLGFEPIFWNRYMFNTQERQTLGLLCQADHPALAAFPTGFFQDWQWQEIVTTARAMLLEGLPAGLRPIVQPIDDWNTNRRLGLIFECRVGRGRLLVCSADLARDLDHRPAARQLRASLLAYAAGAQFRPRTEVPLAALQTVLERTKPSVLLKLGARVVKVTSEDAANGHLGANAVDGDPDTFWHTRWQPQNDPMPHEIVVDLGREATLKGITYLPRQDQANGRIAQAEVFVSAEADRWGEPAIRCRWGDTTERQTAVFDRPRTGRFLKLRVTAEVAGHPFASMAELDVLLP